MLGSKPATFQLKVLRLNQLSYNVFTRGRNNIEINFLRVIIAITFRTFVNMASIRLTSRFRSNVSLSVQSSADHHHRRRRSLRRQQE